MIISLCLLLTASGAAAYDTTYRFSIPSYGISSLSVQAPSVYVNQSFDVNASIIVNDSYSAGYFNATINLSQGFTLVNDIQEKQNPALSGDGSVWSTGWRLNATVPEGSYQLEVDVPFFFSSDSVGIDVVERPLNWSNGTAELSAGGPYHASDAGMLYATLKDSLGNHVNIIGTCYASFHYPNSSLWKGEPLSYIQGTNGSYYTSFIAPQANGTHTVSVVCSVPQVNNSTGFDVFYTPPSPPGGDDQDEDEDGGGGGGGGPVIDIEEPSTGIEVEQEKPDVEIEQGDSDSMRVWVRNTGETAVENVSVTIDGLETTWYIVNPLFADILANSSQEFSIALDIPYNSSTGIFPYFIRVKTPGVEKTLESRLTIILKRNITILGISKSNLVAGEPGVLVVEVENTGETVEAVGISVDFPLGWQFEENSKTREVLPRRVEPFEFKVVPTEGSYNITITSAFSNGQAFNTFGISVSHPVIGIVQIDEIIMISVAVVVLAFAVILVARRLSHKKAKGRDFSLIKDQLGADKEIMERRKGVERIMEKVGEAFDKADEFLDKGDVDNALKQYKKIKKYYEVLEKYGGDAPLNELSERMQNLYERLLSNSDEKSASKESGESSKGSKEDEWGKF